MMQASWEMPWLDCLLVLWLRPRNKEEESIDQIFPFLSSHWQITKASSWLLRAYVKLENNSSKFFLSFLSFAMHTVPSLSPSSSSSSSSSNPFSHLMRASCTKSEWNSATSIPILLLINPTDSRGGKAWVQFGQMSPLHVLQSHGRNREERERERERERGKEGRGKERDTKCNVSLSLSRLVLARLPLLMYWMPFHQSAILFGPLDTPKLETRGLGSSSLFLFLFLFSSRTVNSHSGPCSHG